MKNEYRTWKKKYLNKRLMNGKTEKEMTWKSFYSGSEKTFFVCALRLGKNFHLPEQEWIIDSDFKSRKVL